MKTSFPAGRLLSLDAYRGITMFLLMAEAAFVYGAITENSPDGSIGAVVIKQFHHHPWNGLRFWDLIQPFFMFIVGVAMPFSFAARQRKGASWNDSFRHILRRCFLLLCFGVGLHWVYNGRPVWELWNVLTQLSFTILLTFLILQWDWKRQVVVTIACLILAEVLYRIYDPASPFVKDQNFGSWLDMVLMGKIDDGGGWVTVNCLPTAVHTIWGAICGKLLMSSRAARDKIRPILIAGLIALLLGYGLDFAGITPIIKRIATSSFSLASGGWALLALAFFYWFIDVKGYKRWTTFFAIVGSNSIFIYLFGETIGHQWLVGFGRIFGNGFLEPLGVSTGFAHIISACITLGIMWYLCYWLYQKRIFFKV
jgi:predicted acyltransferase